MSFFKLPFISEQWFQADDLEAFSVRFGFEWRDE